MTPLVSEHLGGLLWFIWFGTSVLIFVVSAIYFRLYPNPNLKRGFRRGFTIAYGAAFFVLIVLSIGRNPVVLVFGAIIALITYLNIRNTVFCDACGKTTYNHAWFERAEYCAKCGARLPQKH